MVQIDYTEMERELARTRKAREMAKANRFLKGPIPWWWLLKAGQIDGSALRLALVIWWKVGVTGSTVVKVNLSECREFGVGRDATRRAIRALQRANLIAVDRKPGRCSIVELLGLA